MAAVAALPRSRPGCGEQAWRRPPASFVRVWRRQGTRMVCAAGRSTSEAPAEVTYRDRPWDHALIRLLNSGMSKVQGGLKPSRSMWEYAAFIELSQALKRGRSAEEQQVAGLAVLQSLVPGPLRVAFRWIHGVDARAASIFAAWGSSIASGFLVGPRCSPHSKVRLGRARCLRPLAKQAIHSGRHPCASHSQAPRHAPPSRVEEGEVETREGPVAAPVVVKIEECRFLAESGNCVGMCVNLCKVPAQRFFTEDVGFPMSMEPNFEDGSCKMVWGKAPAPLDQDPALREPCRFAACRMYNTSGDPCEARPS